MPIRVERGLPGPGSRPGGPPATVTIGNFDGVHLGHRAPLEVVVARARRGGGEAAVVTFDPHPRCVLQPERCPPMITTIEERADLLEEAGVDRLVVLPFDLETSRWPAEHFCDRLLTAFALRSLVVGPDFALGHRRRGDVAFLTDWGRAHGIEVAVVEPLRDATAEPVSSTRIRAALAAGDVELAGRLMGRPWFIEAAVEHGEKRGRSLGYPTANLAVPAGKEIPGRGIYACRVRVGERWWMAATNVGTRPTFGGDHLTVEPYLLDFAGDLYGATVRCDFVARLREERTYATAEELTAQIARDVDETRRLLGAPTGPAADQ
ncbi:MAG TPA: bifunctional riboflavin kinase/FAD synthetase [Candidatus Dormibacteraeota bacterium]|nr:bifunctional riboflavin kinase/FAD synthetase [Candidatus Dormibacteraeota bacterium]